MSPAARSCVGPESRHLCHLLRDLLNRSTNHPRPPAASSSNRPPQHDARLLHGPWPLPHSSPIPTANLFRGIDRVTALPEQVLPRDSGRSYWTPTRPARDIVQLRVRQGQWEICLTTAMPQSGRGTVCLVASDSWPPTFTFGLTDSDEEVQLSSAHWWRSTGWVAATATNNAAGNTVVWSYTLKWYTEPPFTARDGA